MNLVIEISRILFGPEIDKYNVVTNNTDHYKRVTVDGIEYKIGTFLYKILEESEIEFGKIKKVMSSKNIASEKTIITFFIEIYNEINFDVHTHSYIIKRNAMKDRELPLDDIIPNSIVTSIEREHMHHIVTRYKL